MPYAMLNLENQTAPISNASEVDVLDAFRQNKSLNDVRLDFQSEKATQQLYDILDQNRQNPPPKRIINRNGKNIDLFDFAEKMENIYGLSKEYIYLTKLLTIIDCGQTYEDENGIIRFNLYDLFESGCEDLRSILVTTMDVNATSTTTVNQTLLDELLMMDNTSNSTGNDDNIITLEDLAIFGYGRIFDIYNNNIIVNGNENYTIQGSEFIAVELLSLGLIGTNPSLTTIETDRLNDFLLYERLPENYTLLRPKLPYNFLLANDPTYPLFFDCK